MEGGDESGRKVEKQEEAKVAEAEEKRRREREREGGHLAIKNTY